MEHIETSVRFMPPNGVSGNIPVYYREDREQRIGNASFDPTTNIVDIEITDPEMSAFLQQGILTGVSIADISVESN